MIGKENGKMNTDISIIIPVYNQSDRIKECVGNLLKHEKNLRKMNIEIILINDGSEDESEKVCSKLSDKYSQVRFFSQENKGVSAARNTGIRNARGKYILYLDADDDLSPGTLWAVKEFFESVCDETDLVTYRIDTIYDGRELKPHFRYMYLKESGVYDLREYPYIGQTTMNIVVRNRFENNILFDEDQTFSEDQKYCCEVLNDKLKMGFCSEGCYIYHRSDNSASGRMSGACFVFEQCTDMFEQIFERYDERVPAAFQGLFVNDFYWKLCCNMLFPYHYSKEKYESAVERLRKLLDRCDNEIILNHPNIDFFEKYYMLRMKHDHKMTWQVNGYGFGLFDKEKCTVFENSIEIVMTKCKVSDGKVNIFGFLKSVFFQIYPEKPMLLAVENDGNMNRTLPLSPSTHNYYLSHEDTQRFFAFKYECDPEEVRNVRFEMKIENRWFPTHFYFMPCVPFSHDLKRYDYEMNNVKIGIDPENTIHFEIKDESISEEIWLYYDCAGVEKDNGMLQFLHDHSKQDGIKRYYIISDDSQKKHLPKTTAGIVWGSKKHKEMFLKCRKILTAFIEEKNIIPFEESEYDLYSGQFKFEVIYLQHGVLHIDMPWKYSVERLPADKIVISTLNEEKILKRYGYEDENLLKTGMPRFAVKPVKKPNAKRILFAPSWRSYLMGRYIDRKWEPMDRKFISSSYFRGLTEFLTDKKFEDLLEKHDMVMDVKLHPIFKCYERYFQNLSDRVRLVDSTVDTGEYRIFITDFSSYMYDFLYADIPVLYFLPDSDEFKSGMNGYRNLTDESYWRNVKYDTKGIVSETETILEDGNSDLVDKNIFLEKITGYIEE
ncbi:MAG: bifunctional glycosyltransferase family 2 protein/CDP-glycerol:glycerophosphate glycerophosphotransferase [Lachnospiraceae bacterium]|nr:bifunctional glycosyltransferase family 2 protein/CDP-glycerol:glycerophosphate glycerophosphotransferase [Lachnospiraceae bacterium]